MTEKKTEKAVNVTAPHVYQAIANIAGDLAKTGIAKDQNNKMQGYKFRGIDDVYNAIAPLLAEHRLVILPRVQDRIVTERETQKGGVLFYVVLRVDFDFISAWDGSKHTVTTLGEAMDSGDKATNKAMSAAYKYACLEAFCIPTEGDNDADSTTHEVKAKKQPVPFSSEEIVALTKDIQAAKTLDELTVQKDKARAAWPRMSKEQQTTITTNIQKMEHMHVNAPVTE